MNRLLFLFSSHVPQLKLTLIAVDRSQLKDFQPVTPKSSADLYKNFGRSFALYLNNLKKETIFCNFPSASLGKIRPYFGRHFSGHHYFFGHNWSFPAEILAARQRCIVYKCCKPRYFLYKKLCASFEKSVYRKFRLGC
jgi:hypothetical protein